MYLLLFLTGLLLLSTFGRISIYSELNFFTSFFNQLCLNSVPKQSLHVYELNALVCGSNFDSLSISQLYITSGLIHLFVVSGSHLQVLKKILEKIFGRLLIKFQIFIIILLFLYCACCSFNPPIIRSFFFIFLNLYLKNKKIYWNLNFKLFFSGILCLIFNPLWITSTSLQMSWLISIGLLINNLFMKKKHILIQNFILLIILLPSLVFFQVPNIYTVYLNTFLTPILEIFLFPLALLTVLINFIHPLFDLSIEILKLFLKSLEMPPHQQIQDIPITSISLNWFLILMIHLAIHLVLFKKEQNNENF